MKAKFCVAAEESPNVTPVLVMTYPCRSFALGTPAIETRLVNGFSMSVVACAKAMPALKPTPE